MYGIQQQKMVFALKLLTETKERDAISFSSDKLQIDPGKISLFQWREESLFLRLYREASWRQENGEEIS